MTRMEYTVSIDTEPGADEARLHRLNQVLREDARALGPALGMDGSGRIGATFQVEYPLSLELAGRHAVGIVRTALRRAGVKQDVEAMTIRIGGPEA